MDRFELTIELGNAAMQTPEHVAGALRKVAESLQDDAPELDESHRIRDENGNTVGTYHFQG